MIRSMTGYGRGVSTRDGLQTIVELKSVNRRQAEIMVRLPRELESLESKVREEVAKVVARGRCDVIIQLDIGVTRATALVNRELAAAFANELRELSQSLGIQQELQWSDVLRCPGVLQTSSPAADPDVVWAKIQPALTEAMQGLIQMREREGAQLSLDLLGRIATMEESVSRIASRAPEVPLKWKESLLQKIRAAGIETIAADDERVLKEIVLFVDRIDVAEELTRLRSHFDQVRHVIQKGENAGRTLDFLAQEMNREINTIGSKANDSLISQGVVTLKTELERFREQVQNVE